MSEELGLHPSTNSTGAKARIRSICPNPVEVAAAMTVGAAAALVAATGGHDTISTEGAIVRVEPAFDGTVRADAGPVALRVPSKDVLRLPLGASRFIGADARWQGLDATDTSRFSPEKFEEQLVGSANKIRSSITRQFARAGTYGTLAFLGAGVCLPYFRRKGLNGKFSKYVAPAGVVGISVLGVSAVHPDMRETTLEAAQWQSGMNLVPAQYKQQANEILPEQFKHVEVRGANNQVKQWVADQVEGKIIEPLEMYDRVSAEFLSRITEALPPKSQGEKRVLVLSDLHSNFVVAPYIKTVANGTSADVVAFLGDNGSGTFLDRWFVPPLIQAAQEAESVVKVDGNHDNGDSKQAFKDAGVTNLDGKVVVRASGLSIFGAPDNTFSEYGGNTTLIGPETEEYAETLAKEACDTEEPINLAILHRPQVAAALARYGCAEVVGSGHYHSQIDPQAQTKFGMNIEVFRSGSSSGAEGSLSVGSPIGTADITLLSYRLDESGKYRFAGWQRYSVNASGRLEIVPFTIVEPTVTAQDVAAAQKQATTGKRRPNMPVGW